MIDDEEEEEGEEDEPLFQKGYTVQHIFNFHFGSQVLKNYIFLTTLVTDEIYS